MSHSRIPPITFCLMLVFVLAMLAGCIGVSAEKQESEITLAPGEALQLAEPVRVRVVRNDPATGRRVVGYVNATTDNLLGRAPAEEIELEIKSEQPEKKLAARW